jgi:hypothetical protein
MNTTNEENHNQDIRKLEGENTLEQKKYFIDTSSFWQYTGSDSAIDSKPNVIETSEIDAGEMNGDSGLTIDITRYLLETDRNTNDSKYVDLKNQLPTEDKSTEKIENNINASLLKQVEKMNQEISKLKEQLAQLTESNQRIIEKLPLFKISKKKKKKK